MAYAHTSDMYTPRAHRSTCQLSLRGSQLLSIAHHVFSCMDLHVSPFLQTSKLHIPCSTMASAPITERPNALTMGLGSSTAAEVVHLLCQTDAQMFAGWGGHPGLSDDVVLQVSE
jgi:hypothetical protein